MKFVSPMKSATKRFARRLVDLLGRPICCNLPADMTAMRSDMVSASSWSWVTKTKVMPVSCWICFSSTRICWRSFRSSAESGSSSSSTFGAGARARASATRCCCPPES